MISSEKMTGRLAPAVCPPKPKIFGKARSVLTADIGGNSPKFGASRKGRGR